MCYLRISKRFYLIYLHTAPQLTTFVCKFSYGIFMFGDCFITCLPTKDSKLIKWEQATEKNQLEFGHLSEWTSGSIQRMNSANRPLNLLEQSSTNRFPSAGTDCGVVSFMGTRAFEMETVVDFSGQIAEVPIMLFVEVPGMNAQGYAQKWCLLVLLPHQDDDLGYFDAYVTEYRTNCHYHRKSNPLGIIAKTAYM